MRTTDQNEEDRLLKRLVEEERERELMEVLGSGTLPQFPEEEIAQGVNEALARIAVKRREYDNDRAMFWIERTAAGTTRWLLATLQTIGVYGEKVTPALSGVRRKATYRDEGNLVDGHLLERRADPRDWIPVYLSCNKNRICFLTLRLNGNELPKWPAVTLSINGHEKTAFRLYTEDRGESKYLEIRCDTLDGELILQRDLVCCIAIGSSRDLYVALYNDSFLKEDDNDRKRYPSFRITKLR